MRAAPSPTLPHKGGREEYGAYFEFVPDPHHVESTLSNSHFAETRRFASRAIALHPFEGTPLEFPAF